jgi:predicted  nucleic acid-binding Zn ribbon protein
MNNFIPIHQYAKKKDTSRQNIYRWIREGKFCDEDIMTETVTLERMRIKEDAEPTMQCSHIFRVYPNSRIKKCVKCDHVKKDV